jgi:hypothetical protein
MNAPGIAALQSGKPEVKAPEHHSAFLSDRYHLDMMVVPLFLPFWGTAFPGNFYQAQGQ